jgi:hypothetical protein
MDKLNEAAIKEHIKNTCVVLKRSAIVRIENNKVPAIKPPCTIEVTSAMLMGVDRVFPRSSITAFPKNQRDVPANCESTIIKR